MKLVEDILTDRRQAVMAHRARYERSLRRDPEYRALETQIQELGLKLMGNAVGAGEEEEKEEIKARMLRLKAEREALLRSRRLSPYLCPVCRDEGAVDGEICECRRRLIYAEHYGAPEPSSFARGLERYPTARLDDAKEIPECGGFTARRLTTLVVKSASRMLKSYPNGGRGLLILGKTGTGKTSIATAIAKSAQAKGIDTLYMSALRLNDLYYGERMGEPVRLGYLETSGLLLIDDLGIEPITNNVTAQALYRILETRASRDLPSVILSNLSSAGLLSRYGERIFSRLTDARRFLLGVLGGIDLRTGVSH